MVNGWITLGVGGADAEAVSASRAPSDPNSVMFRFKDREAFGELRDRLAAEIEANRAAGIDASTEDTDAAAPSRLNRMEVRNEERRTAAAAAVLGSEPNRHRSCGRADGLAVRRKARAEGPSEPPSRR